MQKSRVERTLQILVATIVVLGTYLLSDGQGLVVLPPMMVCVAVASFYFTDVRKRFEMGQTLSSFVAVSAAVIAAWQMFASSDPSPFMAMANLLSYLQVVLLFQRKTQRVYWQLLMLGLLQVVVSTALSSGLTYGVFVFAFMFMFILSMLLLLIVSQSQACVAGIDAHTWWTQGVSASLAGDQANGRVRFTGQHTPGALWNAFGCKLVGRAAWATLISLLVAGPVFFLVPRKSKGTVRSSALFGIERLIGFSQSVELGRPGRLQSSGEQVMRVTLTNYHTHEPYSIVGELLFRGTVLTRYQEGRWVGAAAQGIVPRMNAADEIVRQQFLLEPLRHDVVPAVYPAIPIEFQPGLRFDNRDRSWHRGGRMTSRRANITLATTGFRRGLLRRVTPCFSDVNLEELKNFPRGRLEQLAAVTQDILREAELENADRRQQALELERFLLDPANGFRYSLTSPPRNRKLDPNEDFLTEHRVGHCEYFASALTLMLRSQGIPARMIVGFRGGDFNPAGDFWTVKQDHAHAWVEVYLEPSQIDPSEMIRSATARGGWLRLDPTPGGTSDTQTRLGLAWWLRIRATVDYMQLVWSAYVEQLDIESQQRWIYRPVAEWTHAVVDTFFGAEMKRRVRRLADSLEIGQGNWFSLRAAGASAAIGLLLFGGFYALRFAWRRVARGGVRDAARAAIAMPAGAEFYRRLEGILDSYGHTRRAGQTPQEVATDAAAHLGAGDASRPLATLPREIVDAYYRVRFGERPLSDEEVGHVTSSLDRLEAGLAIQTE